MYNTIIFDLDDTLTNDKENIRVAFKKVLEYKKETYTDEKFDRFYQIDKKTWRDRASGKLTTPFEDDIKKKTEYVRASRFLNYFENTISYEEAVGLNNLYIYGMMENVVSREGTLDIIQYLYNKNYRLVVATNGPLVPLKTKLEKLKIAEYFSVIFSAEEVGAMKPKKEYFDGLFKKLQIYEKESVLLIGDDLEKDIKGGIDNGIDTCWCNYTGEENKTEYIPTYEINKLEYLKNIL